jgi:hypothetical protein
MYSHKHTQVPLSHVVKTKLHEKSKIVASLRKRFLLYKKEEEREINNCRLSDERLPKKKKFGLEYRARNALSLENMMKAYLVMTGRDLFDTRGWRVRVMRNLSCRSSKDATLAWTAYSSGSS